MGITRLVAGTVTAGALGLAPLVVAAPSQAADTYTTTVVADPGETEVVFGETLSVEVDVDSSRGFSPSGGTTTLLAQRAGSTRWTPVDTTSGSSAYFTGVKPRARTTYKVAYKGFTSRSGNVYESSESATFTVEVARKITYPEGGFVMKGKVTPRYARKKIVITVSEEQNEGYEPWRTIRTSSTGTYKVTLPRRGGIWYWSFDVEGDDQYLATGFVWKTFIS